LFTTLLSIIALYLLTKRYIENWFFWIIANIVYVFMFLEAQLYFSAVLYFINLILCYKGIKEWEKNLIQ
jgi:nicotinamide mononucleotide transporter